MRARWEFDAVRRLSVPGRRPLLSTCPSRGSTADGPPEQMSAIVEGISDADAWSDQKSNLWHSGQTTCADMCSAVRVGFVALMSDGVAVEGRVEVRGGSVWYRLAGEGDGPPLVTLHGGPGYPSASLQTLEALASDRRVVFYDQLGCGNSERPNDPSLWTMERFIDELERLLEHVGLDEVHLLGHSWGTMLAVDYYLSHPEKVRTMILVSPALSASRWKDDSERLISEFPAELRAIYADPDANEEDVERLKSEYMSRHFLRLREAPEPVRRAMEGFAPQVYLTMWGPNEFTPTGSLKVYERTEELPHIGVPVLYLCGRYDSATPEATEQYATATPDADMRIFENSAHHPFIEDADSFTATASKFLGAH